MSATEQKIPDWMVAWQNSYDDPLLFATKVLGFLPAGVDNPDGDLQLEQWQHDLLANFFIGPDGKPAPDARHSISAGHGVGKAQPMVEPVLTPSGWIEIGNLKAGDKVATIDGSFTTVTGTFPQGEKPIFKVVLDDGTFTFAVEDHLWLTTSRLERKRGRPPSIRTTEEIAKSLTFPNGLRTGLNHRLPQFSRPIQHEEVSLPVPPYFLGAYLGNGAAGNGTISFNAEDIEHFSSEFADEISDDGLKIVKKTERSTVALGKITSSIKSALRDLGLGEARSWDKFIPKIYLYASPEQRHALLQGLMDTDGTPGAGNNAATFDTSSEALADGVSEIVRSLGGVARRSGRQGRLNGVDKRWSYRVFISLPENLMPFRSPRKAEKYNPHHGSRNKDRTLGRFIVAVEEAGTADCVCISVAHPSKLYVTRDHIPTHNTVALSILAIWWILTRYDSKCVVTSSSQDQLRDAFWPELRKWVRHLPVELQDQLQVDQERIYIRSEPEMAFIVRRTASKHNPESLQGFHAKFLLFLIDEGSGIEDIIFEVAQGSLSTEGASAVMMSNPTRPDGFFFDTHHRLRHRWKCWRVSSEDVPRARHHIEDVIAAYGKDSNRHRVRVQGLFPTAADDVVIPLQWALDAVDREVVPLDYIPIWGVDVARFGDDSSALAKRQANRLLEPVKEWKNKDLMQLVGILHDEYINTHEDMQPKEILIDVIGIGAGVVDRMRELGLPARGVNVGEGAASVEKCMRLRDELWWRCREWFQSKDCSIPNDEKLIAQLTSPTYDFHSNGKIVVESKKDMKERSLKSPDLADALCLTFHGFSKRKIPMRRTRGPAFRNPWAA
jgi:hypothetical protein